MPVFCTFRDVDDVSCMESDGWFAPFLIGTFTTHADKYLMSAVVDVPVIAATRFEGHVSIALYGLFAFSEVLWLNRCEMALSSEILSISIVRIAFWPTAGTSIS